MSTQEEAPLELPLSSFRVQLQGLTFNTKGGIPHRQLWDNLESGMRLVLVAEPENPYDKNAVLIYKYGDLENDLGYIPREHAESVSRMLLAGIELSAEVDDYWKGDYTIKVRILIRKAFTEDSPSVRKWRQDGPKVGSRYEVRLNSAKGVTRDSKDARQTVCVGDYLEMVYECPKGMTVGEVVAYKRGDRDYKFGYVRGTLRTRILGFAEGGWKLTGEVVEVRDYDSDNGEIEQAVDLAVFGDGTKWDHYA